MATYKVVDADQLNADMTRVADSIRTKGGTTDALVWPDGYKTAIEAIQTGGGSSGGGGGSGGSSGSGQTGVVDTAASYMMIYTYFPDAVSVTVPTRVVTATSAAGELQA